MATSPTFPPWHKAEALTRCHLYWKAERAFPPPQADRQWTTAFLLALDKTLKEKFEVEGYFFLPQHYINDKNVDRFIQMLQDAMPKIGARRVAGEPIPRMNPQYIEDTLANKGTFDTEAFRKYYLFRLAITDLPKYLAELWGSGKAMYLYLPKDPKAAPMPKFPQPKMFQNDPFLGKINVDAQMKGMRSCQHPSWAGSKALFAADLAKEPMMAGLEFVLPFLNTQFYFQQAPEIVEAFMGLFPIQIFESPEDQGIAIASKENLDSILKELVA